MWNYFVSELRQSASQNLSKKDRAVKTAMFFSERFCEADWRKFRNKEAALQPPWLTDGIDGRRLCTLIFSVRGTIKRALVYSPYNRFFLWNPSSPDCLCVSALSVSLYLSVSLSLLSRPVASKLYLTVVRLNNVVYDEWSWITISQIILFPTLLNRILFVGLYFSTYTGHKWLMAHGSLYPLYWNKVSFMKFAEINICTTVKYSLVASRD